MNIILFRKTGCAFLIVGMLISGLSLRSAGTEVKTIEMSSKQMEEALAGKKTNTYIVVSNDEVIDLDGRHFAPGKAKAYLKKAKPEKKAAFIFLMADDSLLETVRSMIDVFGDYGATIFAVRKMPKGGTTVEAPAGGTGAAPGQRTVQLVGLPNPAASSVKDAPPSMAGRPENLRPGKLPPRVRYKFVGDETVVAAAAMTEKLFLSPEAPNCAAHFETVALIQPGAWKYLSDVPELNGAKPLVAKVEMGSKVHKMEGRMLAELGQFTKSVGRIRELLAADGGGKVRALHSDEMNQWWTFISFDIEEPVFAIESKGGKYVFIVSWLRNRIFSLDELKALPTR